MARSCIAVCFLSEAVCTVQLFFTVDGGAHPRMAAALEEVPADREPRLPGQQGGRAGREPSPGDRQSARTMRAVIRGPAAAGAKDSICICGNSDGPPVVCS